MYPNSSLNGMIKNINEPPSILIKRAFFAQFRNIPYKGFVLNEFINKAKETKDDPTKYYEWMMKRTAEIIKENNITDIYEQTSFIDNVDVIYLQINMKRFVIDIPTDNIFDFIGHEALAHYSAKTVMDFKPEKHLNNLEDASFDFRTKDGKYLPLSYRVNKLTYSINYGKYKDVFPINMSVLMWRGENVPNNPTVMLFQGYFFPEIYPKILLNPGEQENLCNRNDRRDKCINKIIEIHDSIERPEIALFKEQNGIDISKSKYGEYINKIPICQMTPRLAENSHCPMLMANPWVVLKYICYAWDMYTHRNSITHKNSKRKSGYAHTKVHVAASKSNEYDYSVVPLHTFYDTERRNNEWKGGHHSSPCEHERAATYRRIFNKDGTIKKIVPVKGCTVNAGNQKTEIINIKAPKRKED